MARESRITAGMVGGIVGALGMDAVAVLWAGPWGNWAALKCPAFPWAMHEGFNLPVVIASQLSHALVAITWGILFGLIFAGKKASTVLLAGPLWGLVVLVVMYYAVLPGFSMRGYVERSGLLYAVAIHLAYGVGLGAGAGGFLAHRRGAFHHRREAWARHAQPAEA